MPFVEGREYRMFASFELSPVSDDATGYIVEGYATTFDIPYDFGPDGMKECIRSSAFDGTDMGDVIFQLNHEGMVMARQRNRTLEIAADAHGLYTRADIGGCQAGRDLYEGIKNGLIDRMSWGFTIADGGWEYDPDTRTAYVNKVKKIYDVSAVSIPANNDTVISARSYIYDAIKEPAEDLSPLAERLRLLTLYTSPSGRGGTR